MPRKDSLVYSKTVNEILRMKIMLILIRYIYLTSGVHGWNTCYHSMNSMAESKLSSVIPPTPLLLHQKRSLYPYSKNHKGDP